MASNGKKRRALRVLRPEWQQQQQRNDDGDNVRRYCGTKTCTEDEEETTDDGLCCCCCYWPSSRPKISRGSSSSKGALESVPTIPGNPKVVVDVAVLENRQSVGARFSRPNLLIIDLKGTFKAVLSGLLFRTSINGNLCNVVHVNHTTHDFDRYGERR